MSAPAEKTFYVECDIGTVYATVEAADEDAALSAAVEKWCIEAADIFNAGTFGVTEGAEV